MFVEPSNLCTAGDTVSPVSSSGASGGSCGRIWTGRWRKLSGSSSCIRSGSRVRISTSCSSSAQHAKWFRAKGSVEQQAQHQSSLLMHHEIYKDYQSTSKAHAAVIQNSEAKLAEFPRGQRAQSIYFALCSIKGGKKQRGPIPNPNPTPDSHTAMF